MMIWYSSDIIEFPIYNFEEDIVTYLFVVVVVFTLDLEVSGLKILISGLTIILLKKYF